VRKWKKEDLAADTGCVPVLHETPRFLLQYMNTVEFFDLFFDADVVNSLVENTVKYAREVKGDHAFELDSETFRLFLAILLLSGYSVRPRRRMYWELQEDVHNDAVSKAMTRRRFEEILRYCHIADNDQLLATDKFSKVRPLLSLLNERWLLFRPPECHLSIDESMIPYYGRHGAKQHMHGKPIRFGFKVWLLATSSGYLIQGEPYQGASTGCTISHLGLGGLVVVDLVSELPRHQKYFLYFDNLFTSLPLPDHLTCDGFGATGTIRVNRTKKAPLQNLKQLQKEGRGSHYFIKDDVSGAVTVQWHDNSIVTLVSNCHSVLPLNQASRWSNKDKKVISVNQTRAISAYNKYMGGVDRLDQNVATYRVSIRTKKWWWSMFYFMLSASVSNAWILYRQSVNYASEKHDLLEFTRRIVLVYLQRYSQIADLKRITQKKRALPEVRFDRMDHVIVSILKQRCCRQCGKKVARLCSKRQVPLHVNCFGPYHDS
jgi:hypothetical protein